MDIVWLALLAVFWGAVAALVAGLGRLETAGRARS
jgi:hypothetical protein